MKKSEINILTARLRGSRVVTRCSGKYIDFDHSQSVSLCIRYLSSGSRAAALDEEYVSTYFLATYTGRYFSSFLYLAYCNFLY